MSLENETTPATETETVNPNPVETTGTETETETTATVAAEPEPQYTCREGCGNQGSAIDFRVRDFRDLIKMIVAKNPETKERVVITPELVAQNATCGNCAERIRTEYGVAFYPLAGTLQRARAFQDKGNTIAATVGSPTTTPATPPAAPLDPEAATPVACWVCGHEQPRATASIMGWWGAQLTAAARLRKQDSSERRPLVHVTSAMLLETEKAKSLVACNNCAPEVKPVLTDQAASLREITDLPEKERPREVARRLNSFPLMAAIRNSRQREENERIARAQEDAEAEARAQASEAKAATIADLFAKKAAGAAAKHDGGKGGKKYGRNGGRERGGGHRGRWGSDD